MNKISIHFDGDIAHNHQVSMRTLGKTLQHLQNAMDRAFIENKYGEVFKHARMRSSDYSETEFLVQEPKEGGYIIDFLSKSETGKKILDRISNAVSPALELAKHEGENEAKTIADQIQTRKLQLEHEILVPEDYENIIKTPSKQIIRKYGDRSINKEFDQILAILRSKHAGDSILEITINSSKSHTFLFNQNISKKFHDVVSTRSIGEPVIYKASVTSLDSKNHSGKIHNKANDKTASIHFSDRTSFLKAKKFLGTRDEMNFIGCPLIEYGAFDPQAGDIYFLDLI